MAIPDRTEIEAWLSELTTKQLSEFFVIAGSLLMKTNVLPGQVPIYAVEMLDEEEFAFYASGPMAVWWGKKLKEAVDRCGGTKREI